ncbi:Sodium-dependent multivitamin transporter [Branchiostoma belcheri]|nr:Sodium-dependent multivitamin transporter [Branchiostoma belcheri]
MGESARHMKDIYRPTRQLQDRRRSMKSEKSKVTWCLGVSIAVCCCLPILYSFLPPFLNPEQAIQGQARMAFAKEEFHNFGAVDYVIFGGMLAITAATGLYHAFAGGGQRTTAKYGESCSAFF